MSILMIVIVLSINMLTKRTDLLSTLVINNINIFNEYNFYNHEGEFWYFTHDLSEEEGHIRSISEGDLFVPQQGWQYLVSTCPTKR